MENGRAMALLLAIYEVIFVIVRSLPTETQMIKLLLAAAFAVFALAAQAQAFPSKPLRIVVPFPPGGAADLSARLLADHLARSLAQPVVIENRPGGSTIIGAEVVFRSPPDGHTILVVFPSFIINPLLRSNMAFDPLRDFKEVGQTLAVPMVIAAHPS